MLSLENAIGNIREKTFADRSRVCVFVRNNIDFDRSDIAEEVRGEIVLFSPRYSSRTDIELALKSMYAQKLDVYAHGGIMVKPTVEHASFPDERWDVMREGAVWDPSHEFLAELPSLRGVRKLSAKRNDIARKRQDMLRAGAEYACKVFNADASGDIYDIVVQQWDADGKPNQEVQGFFLSRKEAEEARDEEFGRLVATHIITKLLEEE